MTGSSARPDLAVYNESLRLPVDELVHRMRELVGAKLVAYIAHLRDTRTVAQWAHGDGSPSPTIEARLRLTYRLASMLAVRESPAVVQGWFQGANAELGDRSPARLLREGDLADFEQRIVAAAREFGS